MLPEHMSDYFSNFVEFVDGYHGIVNLVIR